MSFFSWFSGLFDDSSTGFESTTDSVSEQIEINPANGFPMIGGIGGVDVEGNPYGLGSHFDDFGVGIDTIDTGLNDCGSSTMDVFDSDTSSSWDDSFSTDFGFDSW